MNFSNKEYIETLLKLGLNLSQAKIYLALIFLGVVDAKKIAQTTRIDRGEVYRQLESLRKMALIEKILGFPNQYKPLPLDEAIGALIENKKIEIADIQKKAKVLIKEGVCSDTTEVGVSIVSILPEKSNIQRVPRMFGCLQKEVLGFAQIEDLPKVLNRYYKPFKKAFARGIRIRFIAELNKPTEVALIFIQNYKLENPNFDMRFANPTLLVQFGIFDGKEMEIGLTEGEVLSASNPQLIKVFKDYFELRWKAAMTECPKEEIQ